MTAEFAAECHNGSRESCQFWQNRPDAVIPTKICQTGMHNRTPFLFFLEEGCLWHRPARSQDNEGGGGWCPTPVPERRNPMKISRIMTVDHHKSPGTRHPQRPKHSCVVQRWQHLPTQIVSVGQYIVSKPELWQSMFTSLPAHARTAELKT